METEVSGGAQVGLKGILGIQAAGQESQQGEKSESTTQQIDQTPTSLFAGLRKELQNYDIIRTISCDIGPGDFVEFESTLGMSSAVELLTVMSVFLPLIETMPTQESRGDTQDRRGNTQNRKGNIQKKQSAEMVKLISSLLTAVTAGESQDLVAKVDGFHVVLTTERKFFIDPTMNDVIDGMFHVFGKVTRVIPEDSTDRINLLRKSPMGKLMKSLPQLSETILSIEELGGGEGGVSTEIPGPAIQVIPIAIFV